MNVRTLWVASCWRNVAFQRRTVDTVIVGSPHYSFRLRQSGEMFNATHNCIKNEAISEQSSPQVALLQRIELKKPETKKKNRSVDRLRMGA